MRLFRVGQKQKENGSVILEQNPKLGSGGNVEDEDDEEMAKSGSGDDENARFLHAQTILFVVAIDELSNSACVLDGVIVYGVANCTRS